MASSTPLLASAKFELEYNQGSVYGDDDRAAVLRVLDANAPSCGKEVLAFEKEFAEFSGVSHAIAVGNGSQALELAYRAVLKLTQCTAVRKEVIVPAVSWMATAGAAILAGINTVKFADVVDPTVCVDIEAIKRLVSPNTIAVTVVHLFGRPVDGVEELAEWLKSRNIYLIEDCAHAVGSVTSTGAACGTIGDIGIFSFQQQKNMVTLGEGGMCTTNNPAVRELIVGYRSVCAMSYDPKGKYLALDQMKHPMGHRYWMVDFLDHGHNFRMIDMQAAVGRVQLRRVREWNLRRADIARMIATGLSDISSILRLPDVSNSGSSVHSWHVFHVLVTDAFPLPKEDFMWSMLNEFGIKVWNHYSPMHLATSFRSQGMGSLGDCPVAEALFEQYVSLPIHARLTDAAVLYMIDAIKQLASRTPIVRLAEAPMLNELLKLSEPLSSNNADGNDQAILQQQWSLFEPMVGAAVLDGLFATREANSAISVTRSPGRLDLMGGNDDYTGGLVFECTIAEGTYVAAQAVGTELVLRNRQLSEIDIFIPLDIICRSNLTASKLAAAVMDRFPSKRWLLYVVGVLFWLYKRFPDKMFRHGQQGLSLLIWSQVPLNRGVSSSASVEVAIMKAAAHAFGISMEGELLATACQWAENEVCSSACGLMVRPIVVHPIILSCHCVFRIKWRSLWVGHSWRCVASLLLYAAPLPFQRT